MGRHRKEDQEKWPEKDPDEDTGLKAQLNKKADAGDGIGESSLSPIDTW